ncbi:hypothetical protein ANMWB30_11630 [Arthrobacter sp. MWB30]|nr:hypothetical protein ANMWB30_11630 [Arthrobacter sp. MWB30]
MTWEDDQRICIATRAVRNCVVAAMSRIQEPALIGSSQAGIGTGSEV